MYLRKSQYEEYPDMQGVYIVEKPEWVTVNAAAEMKELCPVSSETLRRMIRRGDVPAGHWMSQPYGDGVIYFIDKNILTSLDYKKRGGQEKPKTDG
jgi:hypothetical protein